MNRLFPAAIAALLACALPGPAAADLFVSPVIVEMVGRPTVTVRIGNQGQQPTQAQVRVFGWTHGKGGDEYPPTEEVVASPPIFDLGPGETQTIRLLARKMPTEREAAYRVFVDQIPGETERRGRGQISFPIRFVLPLFVAAGSEGEARLAGQFQRTSVNAATLAISNTGTKRARFDDLWLVAGGQKIKAPGDFPTYVLAGSAREWTFTGRDANAAAQATKLMVMIDDKEVEIPLGR